MEKEIVAGAIFLLAFISPSESPSPTQTSQPIQEKAFYTVQKEDTLGSIAKKHYDSENYWTNIWNNNSWIENPDVIEENWLLIIRETSELEELKKELSEKLPKPNTTPTNQSNPAFSVSRVTGSLNDTQINFLGNCESGMNAVRNSGNGYFGAFQFSSGTWESMGTGYTRADLAPLEVQIDAVQRLVARSSIFTQFPGCSVRMRAAGLL